MGWCNDQCQGCHSSTLEKEALAKPQVTCPSTPPAACSSMSNCQCIQSGSMYFYKCGDQWCNDQCQGCHSSTLEKDALAKPQATCPSTPPDACSSDCQCIQSGSFYFYKCGDQWCNEQCQGCHSSTLEKEALAKPQATCPSTPPDACSSDCQCIQSGSFYF